MNCNVYIFGELSSGYTQYPEDSSSHILSNIYQLCKAPTQIAIRRDASMMYYCYIRKLNENKYLGLCIAVNGYYISRIDELFSLFEATIEKLAQQGSFIHFANDGSLTTSTAVLKQEEEEIDTLAENLRREFETLGNYTNILPPVDYTVAKDSVKEFNALDDKRDIIRASYTYGYTFLYKDKDFNTVRVNSYRSILSRLNQENNELRTKNEELNKANAKIQRQKKQYRFVAALSVVLIGCGLGLLSLNGSLNSIRSELNQAYKTIEERNDSIESKKKQIAKLNSYANVLRSDLNSEVTRREDVEEEFSSYKEMLAGVQPFIVTSTSFSFSTGYLNFEYYGFQETSMTLYVRAYRDDESYYNSNQMNVLLGHNSFGIYVSSRLDGSKYYSFELLDGNNKILGGARR